MSRFGIYIRVRFGKRVGLRLLFRLFRILTNLRRLRRVVAGITPFQTVANINASVLAALGNGNSAWPPEGTEHVDGVDEDLGVSSFRVLLSIAHDLALPSGLFPGEQHMLAKITEAVNGRVVIFKCFLCGLKFIFGHIRRKVRATASFQNNRMHIRPVLDVSELISLLRLIILGELDFLGSILTFVHHEKAFGHHGSSVEDTRELRSEQVTLLSIERRVRVDFSIEITSEHVLNLSRLNDVLRSAVWQLDPVA